MSKRVVGSDQIRMVGLSNVVLPSLLNFRMEDDREDLMELASSISKHGLLQPIVVRNCTDASLPSGSVELVCGRRRLSAAKALGMKFVACTPIQATDQEALEIALTENIQRKSLNAIEEAEAYKLYLLSFGRGSVKRLSERLGKSEEYVSHRLLLVGLPNVIKDRICRRLLKPAEATELVWLKDAEKQIELSEEIMKRRLSFRQVRRAVKILKEEKVTVEEAARRAAIYFPSLSIPPSREHAAPESTPPWTRDRHDGLLESCQVIPILDRAILVVRTSLSGLDFIAGKEEAGSVRELLMKERNILHEILDEIIREKMQHARQVKSGNDPCFLLKPVKVDRGPGAPSLGISQSRNRITR